MGNETPSIEMADSTSFNPGDQPAQEQAGDHRHPPDPHRQEPVKGGEFADDRGGVLGSVRCGTHAITNVSAVGSAELRMDESCCNAAGMTQ